MNKWFGPRERILAFGPKTVCDEELLSVLLRTGPPKTDVGETPGVLQLAAALRERFGSLAGVFAASREELELVVGIGSSKAAMLIAVAEIARRLQVPTLESRPRLTRPEDAYRLFHDLAFESQESVCAAFLDTQNRLICRKEIFRGTVDASLAQPREILREALRANASRLVLVHNHPSDQVEPSEEDRSFTARVAEACAWVGLNLLDHVIVGRGGQFYSFAVQGELNSVPVPEIVTTSASKSPLGD